MRERCRYCWGDDDFTVRYWDWTKSENRDVLFVDEKLGENDYDGEVTGELMTNWYIVCALQDGRKPDRSGVCDPTITPGNSHVFRCGRAGECSWPDWPDKENVRKGLNDFAKYRTITNPNSEIINKYDMMSFSNYLEGFARDDNCEASIESYKRELLCGEDPKDLENTTSIRRRLHNLVRILCNLKVSVYFVWAGSCIGRI